METKKIALSQRLRKTQVNVLCLEQKLLLKSAILSKVQLSCLEAKLYQDPGTIAKVCKAFDHVKARLCLVCTERL